METLHPYTQMYKLQLFHKMLQELLQIFSKLNHKIPINILLGSCKNNAVLWGCGHLIFLPEEVGWFFLSERHPEWFSTVCVVLRLVPTSSPEWCEFRSDHPGWSWTIAEAISTCVWWPISLEGCHGSLCSVCTSKGPQTDDSANNLTFTLTTLTKPQCSGKYKCNGGVDTAGNYLLHS